MEPFSWTCPFCTQLATITFPDVDFTNAELRTDNKHGPRQLDIRFVVCPNPECKEFTLDVSLLEAKILSSGSLSADEDKPLNSWQLVPESKAKVFPDYIPEAIMQDYREACLVQYLSPKASATLARRCIQGIIRDFFGVEKGNLAEEIRAVEDKIDPPIWKAVDAARKVGNIGAHMEKDINLIIEVDPEEALQLIRLIELLLKELYVARQEREENVEAVIALGEEKQQARRLS